ncbi:MAG TPA: PepSY-associated TM helix domain-containing protein [Dokdonella sp.]
MKISSAMLRTFNTVHTWVGLAAGFALFVAFYAGAITVFHHALPLWQSPHLQEGVQSLADAQRLLDGVLERHPEARTHMGMLFPGSELPHSIAYWQDASGVWQFATLDDLDGSPQRPSTELADLVNQLHYSLGLPIAGTYLMGLVSLLYGVALFSGLLIHWPKLTKDLFALRPGRNLKQFWQDAHNVIGVLSLPFHILFAVTGVVLCLVFVLASALDPLVFDGKLMAALPAALDTAPQKSAANISAPPGSLALWQARSIEAAHAQGIETFEPAYLKLANAGDANAVVEITGVSSRALGPQGSIALDAASGELLAVQLPGQRDVNHATLASAYALHFGEYGNGVVPWLYFLLGLGGAFLFYSGNLLWIESRRKRRQLQQSRTATNMARATVGLCIGFCVAVSAAFVAAQVFEAIAPGQIDAGIRRTCFASWALCMAWAAMRAPAQAARELLWLAAGVTAAVAIAHGLVSGEWFWSGAARGPRTASFVDVIAIAMSIAFAMLARATAYRMRHGDPNSVWANPAVRS